MRIILSADDGYHLDFLPLASAGWRKFFSEYKVDLVISSGGKFREGDYHSFCDPWIDNLRVVQRPKDAGLGPSAKIARLWLAGQFGDETCTLHDIDFTPLQRGFYESKYAQYQHGTIMTMGQEVYFGNSEELGKVPMSALTMESDRFTKVVNPEGFSFEALYNSFIEPIQGSVGDSRECVDAPVFSDESLMVALLNRYGRDLIVGIERGYDRLSDTLDRDNWMPDKNKLWAGGYYEAHMHKINTEWERKRCNVIAEFLGVADEWQDGKHWTDISGQWEGIRQNDPDPNPEITAI